MAGFIRVVDIGGNGMRRTEIKDGELISPVLETSLPRNLDEFINFVLSELSPDTSIIAFASAGVIENHKRIVNSPNIPILSGIDLEELLKERTNVKIIVFNDMEASVLGMAQVFPWLTSSYYMGITWSTGIGARVVKGREIVSNMEAGHICIDNSPYALLCGCGKRGCVEAIVSGGAIERRIVQETSLMGIQIPSGMHPCKFFDMALSAYEKWKSPYEKWVLGIKEIIVEGMATFLATIQSLFCLSYIVWKGTFAQRLNKLVFAEIKERMKEKVINPTWVDKLTFCYIPLECKNIDSFKGAAFLAEKLLNS